MRIGDAVPQDAERREKVEGTKTGEGQRIWIQKSAETLLDSVSTTYPSEGQQGAISTARPYRQGPDVPRNQQDRPQGQDHENRAACPSVDTEVTDRRKVRPRSGEATAIINEELIIGKG